jgi:hypothetical protein
MILLMEEWAAGEAHNKQIRITICRSLSFLRQRCSAAEPREVYQRALQKHKLDPAFQKGLMAVSQKKLTTRRTGMRGEPEAISPCIDFWPCDMRGSTFAACPKSKSTPNNLQST